MNRNRRILIITFVVFTGIILLLTIDMARRTTAPWNKRRQLERAFPVDSDRTAIDTVDMDTLGR